MRKIKILSIILVLFLLLASTVVYGADEKFNLKLGLDSGKTNVQRGDTIKINVVLDSVSVENLGGYMANLVFDESIFEGVDISNNGVVLVSGSDTELTVFKKGTITKVISLKVKDDAKLNEQTEIKLENIVGAYYTSTDAGVEQINGSCDSLKLTVTEEDLEEKTLEGIEVSEEPAKTTYTEGEKFDKTGMKITAKYSDGSSKEVTDYTYTPEGNLLESDSKITITYTEGNITKTTEQEITVNKENDSNQTKDDQNDNNKDNTNIKSDEDNQNDNNKDNANIKSDVDNKNDNNNTQTTNNTDKLNSDKSQAGNRIPQTGAKEIIIPLIVASAVLVLSFIGYKKYKEIK